MLVWGQNQSKEPFEWSSENSHFPLAVFLDQILFWWRMIVNSNNRTKWASTTSTNELVHTINHRQTNSNQRANIRNLNSKVSLTAPLALAFPIWLQQTISTNCPPPRAPPTRLVGTTRVADEFTFYCNLRLGDNDPDPEIKGSQVFIRLHHQTAPSCRDSGKQKQQPDKDCNYSLIAPNH